MRGLVDAVQGTPTPPCDTEGGCPHRAECSARHLACEAFAWYVQGKDRPPVLRTRPPDRIPSAEVYRRVYGGHAGE